MLVVEKGCSWCGLLVLHVNDASIKNRIGSWSNFKCELSILLKEKKKGSICIFLSSLKCYSVGKKIFPFVPLIARESDLRNAFVLVVLMMQVLE